MLRFEYWNRQWSPPPNSMTGSGAGYCTTRPSRPANSDSDHEATSSKDIFGSADEEEIKARGGGGCQADDGMDLPRMHS